MSKSKKSTAESHIVSVTAISPERKGMKAYLEEHKPKEMSIQEKDVICRMTEETDQLEYPLKELQMAYGKPEQVYEIPEKDKEKVLKDLWPFAGCPAIDETLYDIHEDATFVFRDAQVIRCRGRNIIVSPYYQKTGGMIVDFVRQDQRDESVFTSELKAKAEE